MRSEDVPPELGIKAKRFLIIDSNPDSDDIKFFTVSEIMAEAFDLKAFYVDQDLRMIYCYALESQLHSIRQSNKHDFRRELVAAGFRHRNKVGGIFSPLEEGTEPPP